MRPYKRGLIDVRVDRLGTDRTVGFSETGVDVNLVSKPSGVMARSVYFVIGLKLRIDIEFPYFID